MNKISLTCIALCAGLSAFAQDDVYFVPTKKAIQKEREENVGYRQSRVYEVPTEDFEYDNWAIGRSNGNRGVDEYNRRTSRYGRGKDSLTRSRAYEEEAPYTATSRIVRFRSPGISIVTSPYYYDYYDFVSYDPWIDDWAWGGWRTSFNPFYYNRWGSWYTPWNYSYSYWGSPWRYGWYDSYWSYSWGSPYYYGGWSSPFYYDYPSSYSYSRPTHSVSYGTTTGRNSRDGVFNSASNEWGRGVVYGNTRAYNNQHDNTNYNYGSGTSYRGSRVNTDRMNSGDGSYYNSGSRANSYSRSGSSGTTNSYQGSYQRSGSVFGSGNYNGSSYSGGTRSNSGYSGGGYSGGGYSGGNSGGSTRQGGTIVGGRR